MYNDNYSFPTLINVTFSANAANDSGGGMYNANSSSPTLINVTFSGNTANKNGGGMYNVDASPTLINATFWGNTANDNGGGMYNNNNDSAGPKVINSLFWGNTGTGETEGHQIFMHNDLIGGVENMALYYCIVQHGVPQDASDGGIGKDPNGGATIAITEKGTVTASTAPLDTTLGNNGGYVETHVLPLGSQAINAGLYVMDAIDSNGLTWYYSDDLATWYSDLDLQTSVSTLPNAQNTLATDARGVDRDRPDIGAYEYSQ